MSMRDPAQRPQITVLDISLSFCRASDKRAMQGAHFSCSCSADTAPSMLAMYFLSLAVARAGSWPCRGGSCTDPGSDPGPGPGSAPAAAAGAVPAPLPEAAAAPPGLLSCATSAKASNHAHPWQLSILAQVQGLVCHTSWRGGVPLALGLAQHLACLASAHPFGVVLHHTLIAPVQRRAGGLAPGARRRGSAQHPVRAASGT